MNRVLVTGGCGFIGVNLALHLLEKEYELVVYDNFYQRDDTVLRNACQSADGPVPKVVEGDLLDEELLESVVREEKIDAIVHLAAFTNVRVSTRNPDKDFLTNSRGTFTVLEAAREVESVESFVLASSNAAIGEVEGSVDERCVPEPLSPYGANKLHGEALCNVYHECYGLRTTALRFANAYGPYSAHKTSVVPKFIRRARAGKPLEIYGDGEQTRDFIHAADIASAIRTVLENDRAGGEVYQVASGTETKIEDLATTIKELAEDEGKSVEVVHTDPREGEIKYNFSSIDKIRDQLGWGHERVLEPSLESLFRDT